MTNSILISSHALYLPWEPLKKKKKRKKKGLRKIACVVGLLELLIGHSLGSTTPHSMACFNYQFCIYLFIFWKRHGPGIVCLEHVIVSHFYPTLAAIKKKN